MKGPRLLQLLQYILQTEKKRNLQNNQHVINYDNLKIFKL